MSEGRSLLAVGMCVLEKRDLIHPLKLDPVSGHAK